MRAEGSWIIAKDAWNLLFIPSTVECKWLASMLWMKLKTPAQLYLAELGSWLSTLDAGMSEQLESYYACRVRSRSEVRNPLGVTQETTPSGHAFHFTHPTGLVQPRHGLLALDDHRRLSRATKVHGGS